MDPVIGMGPERLLVDLLHALFLGVVKDLSMSIVWELILTNAYDLPIIASAPEKQASAIERMFVELIAFYKRWHAAFPSEPLTEVQQFSAGLIGSPLKRCLRTKASETKRGSCSSWWISWPCGMGG